MKLPLITSRELVGYNGNKIVYDVYGIFTEYGYERIFMYRREYEQ